MSLKEFWWFCKREERTLKEIEAQERKNGGGSAEFETESFL